MKRLLVVMFALCLVFSVSFAETVDESFYVGTWVNYAFLKDGGFSVTMFHLSDDHTAYFLIRHVPADLDSSGRENIKTWSAEGNNVSVVTGNTTLDLFVTDDYRLARDIYGGYEIYVKVGGPFAGAGKQVDDLNSLETGYLLDPGQYIVGEDLPAGNYRFEYYENPTDIFVHKKPDSSLWSAYASVTKKSPVYAKLNLPEGSRLDIVAFPVIIMYAKPLNLGDT